ncbi:FHA domain-containing protein [Nocardioides ginsengisegetis]|uniref:FHA domain-containing protein n=1 Tax=Nocardioides ginsengisegetis TaxID=661491 RepID=UPI001FE8DCF0|nr:FHA domain-containing protein [Nocardioides ginsengisegetis]
MSVPTAGSTSSWTSMRVVLAPGDLVVAREGLAILVADPRTPGQESVVDRLQELCTEVGRSVAPGAARDLVRACAMLLANSAPPDVPALGVVTVDRDHLVVTLTDGMRMAVTGPDGTSDLVSSDDSLLPVNRVLRPGVTRVVVGPDPGRLDPDRRSNLSGGVVRAGGVFLEPTAPVAQDGHLHETLVDLEPVPQPAPPAAEPEPEPVPEPPTFTTFSLEPEPEPEPAAPMPDVDEDGPLVRGIVCSRGHFNPPDARFCERCGISTVQQTHNVITGHRPPLGVLVLDDGSVHALIRDYVIGRDPGAADDVRDGRATALVLEDPDLSLSRVHARLVLDGWDVRVEDAGSVNGTYVADPGSEEWRRLEADVPTTIPAGSRLRMGARTMTFESHHKL